MRATLLLILLLGLASCATRPCTFDDWLVTPSCK